MKEPENLLLTFRRKMTMVFLVGMLSALLIKNWVVVIVVVTIAVIILSLI